MVKKYILPFAQGIEEARHYIAEAMKQEKTENVGNHLDPEHEHEILECEEEEQELHPDFVQLNPDEQDFENDLKQTKKTLRNIELKATNEILYDARCLDQFQKKILHRGIRFAQDINIARKGKKSYPRASFMIGHGGAGSGKSTVINVLYQHITNILRRDDPACPNVMLSAFTGAAASNIMGQTRHTLFSFIFGSGFQSLADKARDQKRTLFKNLKVLIIDEFSLVDADMLIF